MSATNTLRFPRTEMLGLVNGKVELSHHPEENPFAIKQLHNFRELYTTFRFLFGQTGCSSTSSREMSSDSEVEDLLTRPVELPVINKIRNLELLSTDAIDTNCLSCPKRSHHAPHDVKPRPLSPLLQLSEKDHFMVHA